MAHTGPAEKKEWPQCHRESSWQVRQSRLCQKEKEQCRLGREMRSEREHGEERVDSTVKERRFQGGEGG